MEYHKLFGFLEDYCETSDEVSKAQLKKVYKDFGDPEDAVKAAVAWFGDADQTYRLKTTGQSIKKTVKRYFYAYEVAASALKASKKNGVESRYTDIDRRVYEALSEYFEGIVEDYFYAEFGDSFKDYVEMRLEEEETEKKIKGIKAAIGGKRRSITSKKNKLDATDNEEERKKLEDEIALAESEESKLNAELEALKQ